MRRALAIGAGAVLAAVVACSSFGSDNGGATPSEVDGGDAAAVGTEAAPPPCDPGQVLSDPNNCGACGHSCLGGACSAGACQPVVVGEQPVDAPIVDVVLQGDRVLWIAFTDIDGAANAVSGLYACPKTGCTGVPTELANGKYPGNLASDGTKAFVSFIFGGINTIYEIQPTKMVKLNVSHLDARQLAVRPDGLFYTGMYEGDGGYARTVWMWDGTAETRVAELDAPSNTFTTVYTKDRVYLGSHSTDYIASSPLTNGGFVPYLTNAPALVSAMAASPDTVFWIEYGTLWSCANGAACGGAAEELTKSDLEGGAALGVTFTGGELFVQTDKGTLFACHPANCKPTVRKVATTVALATDFVTYGHSVVADTEAVYYGVRDPDGDGGSKWRVMKIAR